MLAFAFFCGCVRIKPTLEQTREAYRLVDQGTLELREGSIDKAKASFEVAFEIGQITSALDGIGCAAYAAGDLKQAEYWFFKAYQHDPSYVPAIRNLASVYEAKGEVANAEQLLRDAISADPGDYRARNNLAVLLRDFDRGKLNEASGELRKAFATVPHPTIEQNIDILLSEDYVKKNK